MSDKSREKKQDDQAGSHGAAPKGGQTCPICGKPADSAHRPFCSKRCADIDLNRWLKGSYAIPGRDGEAAEIISDDEAGET